MADFVAATPSRPGKKSLITTSIFFN